MDPDLSSGNGSNRSLRKLLLSWSSDRKSLRFVFAIHSSRYYSHTRRKSVYYCEVQVPRFPRVSITLSVFLPPSLSSSFSLFRSLLISSPIRAPILLFLLCSPSPVAFSLCERISLGFATCSSLLCPELSVHPWNNPLLPFLILLHTFTFRYRWSSMKDP